MNLAGSLSKPKMRVAQTQWAPMKVLSTVLGTGSCTKPGLPSSLRQSSCDMTAWMSASQVAEMPTSRNLHQAMHGGVGILRSATRPRQSMVMPWQPSSSRILRAAK